MGYKVVSADETGGTPLPMIKKHFNHKSLLIITTCVTALCILLMGMRVPDISRPQRPKQPHRAFIEKHVKSSQQAVKKSQEIFSLPATPVEPAAAAQYRPHRLFASQATGFPPLFPDLSRAPPARSA